MDKGIVNILKIYGCGYIADDYKEMIEEIEVFVKERELSQPLTVDKDIKALDVEEIIERINNLIDTHVVTKENKEVTTERILNILQQFKPTIVSDIDKAFFDHKLIDRIRRSQSDAEARRFIKEKLTSK